MPASPMNPASPLSRPATRLAVLMGDAQGAPPAAADRVPWLSVSSITLGTGGRAPCEALLVVDLADAGVRYQDATAPYGHNRLIEIRKIGPTGDIDQLLAWGKIVSQGQELDSRRESLTIRMRLEWYLAAPLRVTAMPYWDGRQPTTPKNARVNVTGCVFNPVLDDTLRGNRSSRTQSDAGDAFYFADPEGFETGLARSTQSQALDRWTPAQAVHRLCWSLNPDEEHLANPPLTLLEQWLGTSRDSLFRNVTIPVGATLYEALDLILQPLGFSWRLDFKGVPGQTVTRLVVFELGAGLRTALRLQRIGASIDAGQTDIDSAQVTYDIASHPNVIIGLSGVERRELTVQLRPDWAQAYDAVDHGRLLADVFFQQDGPGRDVGRKWILNEAGDGQRAGTTFPNWPAGPVSLGPLTESQAVRCGMRMPLTRRRRFHPCLTRSEVDGQPVGDNGYVLRYPNHAGTPGAFPWSYGVLERECGIQIEGPIPRELWTAYQVHAAQGLPYYLELTASIEFDQRHVIRVERRPESVNGADVPLVLDLSDRFGARRVQGMGWHTLRDDGAGGWTTSADSLNHSGLMQSRHYSARHDELMQVLPGPAGTAQLVARNSVPTLLPPLLPGQSVTVIDSDICEGRFTAKAITGNVITVEEAIDDVPVTPAGTALGILCFNTDEDDCRRRMRKFLERVQADQDHAQVAVAVSLPGIDHPQYRPGLLIDGLQPRNVTFASTAGSAPRLPQVLGITYQFDAGGQRTVLTLEQQRVQTTH